MIFGSVHLILLLMKIILVFCGFRRTIMDANVSLLFMNILVVSE
jgi:hypothetical protein